MAVTPNWTGMYGMHFVLFTDVITPAMYITWLLLEAYLTIQIDEFKRQDALTQQRYSNAIGKLREYK